MTQKTFNIQVRRAGAAKSTAKSAKSAGAADDTGALAALAALRARLEAVEGLWQPDADNPGCIVTPYSAYSRAGISALGMAPDISGSGSGEATGTVGLYTDWADTPADGDALAASVGVQLRRASTDAFARAEQAEYTAMRHTGAHIARTDGAGMPLQRGLIGSAAVPGAIYRNLGYARILLYSSAGTHTVDLAQYFSSSTPDTTLTLGAMKASGATLDALDGTTLTYTVEPGKKSHQPSVIVPLPPALADGRYLRRNVLSGLIESSSKDDRFTPAAEVTPPPPVMADLKDLLTPDPTAALRGYDVQRRRHVLSRDRWRHKWVRPQRIKRVGVYRVRRHTRRGHCSPWVYVSVAHGRIKIIS